MAFLGALGERAPGATDNLQTTDAVGNYNTATGNQNQLVAMLQKIAAGNGGPNLADSELQAATQRNAQANAAAVASQRGLQNPLLAARQILGTTAELNQNEAGQAAQARLAQQIEAQQQLGQVLQGQAGTAASVDNAQNAAQLQNQQLAQSGYSTDLNAAGSLLSGIGSTALGGASLAAGLPPLPKGVPLLSPASGNGGPPNLYGTQVQSVTLPDGSKPLGLAHGGDVGELTPLRKAFVDAYCAAHGGDVVGKEDLLNAFNAGKEHAESMKAGGEVAGPPAPYPGDDTRNDTQLRALSVGEHVVPRTVAMDPKNRALMAALEQQEAAAKVMHSSSGPMLAMRRGGR